MATRNNQLLIAITIFVAGSLLFAYWIYHSTYRYHRQTIDEKLHIAGHATAGLLGDDYHANLTNETSISTAKEQETILLLNKLVSDIDVYYLYTVIMENGKILFATSSQTPEELARKETVYFDPYDDADQLIYEAFITGEEYYAEYKDQWGEFRSIFIPMTATDGRRYVVGADVSISEIKTLATNSALKALLAWLFLGLIVLPLVWYYVKSIRREAQLEINRLFHDPLTGLPNRYKLVEDLKNSQYPKLAVMSFDRFHEINAAYGIAIGDQILQRFAQRLLDLSHPQVEDFKVYRLHGDTFAFFFDQSISYNDLKRIVLKFIDDITANFFIGSKQINLTLTVGAVTHVSDPLELAEMAFHEAQKTHQPIVTYDNEILLPDVYIDNLEQITVLKQALEQDRLVPFYMPILNIKTGEIEKYECLARIIDDEGNVIAEPNDFLPVAYRAKLYRQVTRTILNHAIEKIRETGKVISINISTTDMNDPRTSQYLYRRIKATGLGENINIEVLETEQISDYKTARYFLNQLKSLGCKIGIDDLGRDYSNYERLVKLPFDFIKVDRTVIEHIHENPEADQLTRALVKLAHEYGLETVAEYCFSKDIYDIVVKLGFDYAQGFYIGKPQSDTETNNLIQINGANA